MEVVHATTFLYGTIRAREIPPRSGRFWETSKSPYRRKILKFREISKFLENPHFLALARLVIHFLGAISPFLDIIVQNVTTAAPSNGSVYGK